MLTAFKNFVSKKPEIHFHNFISLQGAAYRVFKSHVDISCKQFHLSSLEVSVLTLLVGVPDGKRYNHIAQEIAVEPPFVTELVSKLVKKKYIEVKNDPRDKRAKVITLTEKGKDITTQVAKIADQLFEKLFQNTPTQEIAAYKKILETIIASKPY